VLGVFTDHTHDAAPMNDLALHADFLHRCPNFHVSLVLAALGDADDGAILLVPVNDPAAREVIRRKLHRDAISRQDADEILAHLSGDVSQHLMLVFELDAEHRVWERLNDSGHYFNGVFLAAVLLRLLFPRVWPTIHALLVLPVLLCLPTN
jgi:hypothetical protein